MIWGWVRAVGWDARELTQSQGLGGAGGGRGAHQVQALQFEAVDGTALAAVHVVAQRQDDLEGKSTGDGGVREE